MWFPWLPWLPSGVVIVWNIIIAWQSLAQRIQNCWMWCWTPIKPELRQCFHGTNDFLEKSQIVILSWPFVAKEIQTTPEVVAQFLHFVPALRILYVVEIVLSASLMTHYFWCIQSRLFLCCVVWCLNWGIWHFGLRFFCASFARHLDSPNSKLPNSIQKWWIISTYWY